MKLSECSVFSGYYVLPLHNDGTSHSPTNLCSRLWVRVLVPILERSYTGPGEVVLMRVGILHSLYNLHLYTLNTKGIYHFFI